MKKIGEIRDKNGITLVALIITIIVLLILAGVTIGMLFGDNGIIKNAQEAAKEYTNKAELENEMLSRVEAEMQNYIGGGQTILADKVSIGDYVNYIPDEVVVTSETQIIKDLASYSGYTGTSYNTESQITQESLNWRVLDIVDGQVVLISELPTTHWVYLAGESGYNNAVKLLDDLCYSLYSKTGVGTARNLKIEDIEDKMDLSVWDYHSYPNSNVNTGLYGGTKTYTTAIYRYYPNIFAQEKTGNVGGTQGTTYGLSEQNSFITGTTQAGTSGITVTQTHWYKSMATTNFKDYNSNTAKSIYYELFFNKSGNTISYWLSSRCTSAGVSTAEFRVRYVSGSGVNSESVRTSTTSGGGSNNKIRPVVMLNPNIEIDLSNTENDGSTSSLAWNLK